MDVGPPDAARLEGVFFGDFVAEVDGGAAVEARVGLLVDEGGAVGVGGWGFGVEGGAGVGAWFGGWEGGGEGAEAAEAAEGWGWFGEGHCDEGGFVGASEEVIGNGGVEIEGQWWDMLVAGYNLQGYKWCSWS